MALVSLREMTNGAGVTFDPATSSREILFAEDWNAVRECLQEGKTGIRTRDLEVVGDSNIGGDATITNALTVAGVTTISGNFSASGAATFQDDLNVQGAANVTGDFTVAGNVTVTGTLSIQSSGGTTVSPAHRHDGADGTQKIPVTSIVGVTGITSWAEHDHATDGSAAIPFDAIVGVTAGRTWAQHDHAGDGSPQIGAAAIGDGEVTFVKIDPAAFGTTADSIARGDRISSFSTGFASFFQQHGTLLFLGPGDFGQVAPGTMTLPTSFYGESSGATQNSGLIGLHWDVSSGTDYSSGTSVLLPGQSTSYDNIEITLYWASSTNMGANAAQFLLTIDGALSTGGTIQNLSGLVPKTMTINLTGGTADVMQATTLPTTYQDLTPPVDLTQNYNPDASHYMGMRIDIFNGASSYSDHIYVFGIGISLTNLSV